MKKNILKGAALAAIALAGFTATAQEEGAESALQLSGSVDANFGANINGRNGADNTELPTSFYNTDGFSVGMFNLVASKQVGKVGFVADVAYGPTADAAINGVDSDENRTTSSVVNQLFVSYAVSEGTTLTLGRFNTFLGYEVISPTGNFNYSTSYLFSAGPFSHTGLKADFTLSEEFSLTAAILNSTDASVVENTNGKYTGGLQLGYAVDNGSAFLNFLYGRNGASDEETFQVDLTTGWDISEEFYLGLNASYNTTDGSDFYGAALYPQYALSESFTLGLRFEYYEETEFGGGLLSNEDLLLADADVFATTLTGSYSVGALTIKPELRLDSASEDFFAEDATDFTDSLAVFRLGAIYAF